MKRSQLWLGIILLGLSLGQAQAAPQMSAAEFGKRPKLVLTLVIDQFRADYLTRFRNRFLPAQNGSKLGGFEYLISSGAYYPFAQYDILQSMTGPGHSMILTGTYPYLSGIPINHWYDSAAHHSVYCVQDPDAQQGMSPRNSMATTVGDELKNAGFPSRVVAISLKDRAAVLLGGQHPDYALWLDSTKLSWGSSPYYLKGRTLPTWVAELNDDLAQKKGQDYDWTSEGVPTGLTVSTSPIMHKTWYGSRESLQYPFGLHITTSAAIRALDALKLGQGKSPDLLAVSYSSHDYLAHQYGPNTLELEEMTVAEDREISSLLNHIANQLPGGLKDVVIVLTADHGGPPSSAWLKSVGVDAGSVSSQELLDKIETRLVKRFGKPDSGPWVESVLDFNFYFNRGAIEAKHLSVEPFENEAKSELILNHAAAFVFGRTDYEKRILPPGIMERQILKTYVPGRSGDVVMIPRPFYAPDADPVDHLTGWSYDRSVPLIVVGNRVQKGVYSQSADIIDVAPTLSFLLGTVQPALSQGRVLTEILTKGSP